MCFICGSARHGRETNHSEHGFVLLTFCDSTDSDIILPHTDYITNVGWFLNKIFCICKTPSLLSNLCVICVAIVYISK
jgi:hypothetical protein